MKKSLSKIRLFSAILIKGEQCPPDINHEGTKDAGKDKLPFNNV